MKIWIFVLSVIAVFLYIASKFMVNYVYNDSKELLMAKYGTSKVLTIAALLRIISIFALFADFILILLKLLNIC